MSDNILCLKYQAKALIENISAMKTTAKRIRASGGELNDSFKKMLLEYKHELDDINEKLKVLERKQNAG